MIVPRIARAAAGLLLAATLALAAASTTAAASGPDHPPTNKAATAQQKSPNHKKSGDNKKKPKPAPTASPVQDLNSPQADFEITFSADGKTAVFASSREGGFGGNDVYTSHLVRGRWQTPVNIGSAINSQSDEQEATLSDDGNTLYFTRYTNSLNGDLYVSRNVNGIWQAAKNWNDVPELPHLNSSDSEEHCPIIVNENLIYFSHNEPGVTRESDIFQVERVNGVWGEPTPLPGKVNTPYRDHIHWTGLSKDGKALIIVSDKPHRGTDRISAEWISYQDKRGNWSEPLNLGPLVNTPQGEVCWTFTPDGKYFVGASSRPGGQGGSDLWRVKRTNVPLLKNFHPDATPPINLLKPATGAGR